jgi:mutator protein MutT
MSSGIINVAAAVVIYDSKVLLAKRRGGYLDDLWEFPGGKIEAGETASAAARRELIEELDIYINASSTLLVLEHAYPDKTVRLHFIKCHLTHTKENCLEKLNTNEETGWFNPDNFPYNRFCPADKIAAKHIQWKNIILSEER